MKMKFLRTYKRNYFIIINRYSKRNFTSIYLREDFFPAMVTYAKNMKRRNAKSLNARKSFIYPISVNTFLKI